MKRAHRNIHPVWLVILTASLCTGCGTQAGSSPTPTAASIVVEPVSQTVPLGNAASFSVGAVGSGTLRYQWYENGQQIPSATDASYTTAAVSAEDNGEKFTVQVSNTVNIVTSTQAVLNVGPRSPAAGDLRFQEVDTPDEAEQGNPADTFTDGVVPGYLTQVTNATGSPLELGGACVAGSAYDCIWRVWSTTLPPGQNGLDFYTYSDAYSNFDSDLSKGVVGTYQFAGATNNVITSLDLEPGSSSYAMTWVKASNGGSTFNMQRQVVTPGTVGATVAADAQQGRVVTALSFDDDTGDVDLISYTWQNDTSTIYDTLVLSSLPSDVASTASTLAGDGYIITAFGGNTNDGYLLVGTKVKGDTLPRPLLVDPSSKPLTSDQMAGYSPVAWSWYPVQGTDGDTVIVYEK